MSVGFALRPVQEGGACPFWEVEDDGVVERLGLAEHATRLRRHDESKELERVLDLGHPLRALLHQVGDV